MGHKTRLLLCVLDPIKYNTKESIHFSYDRLKNRHIDITSLWICNGYYIINEQLLIKGRRERIQCPPNSMGEYTRPAKRLGLESNKRYTLNYMIKLYMMHILSYLIGRVMLNMDAQ